MKQEAPISLGGSSSLEQRKEVYKMRKTISNKTTKERIFDAINEGFFLDERNCKRYIVTDLMNCHQTAHTNCH